MTRSLFLGIWLACFAMCQSASATPFLSDFSKLYWLTDSIPPVITCPASDTVQLSAGQCGYVLSYEVLATDDQPDVIVVRSAGLASGATFPIGVTVNSFVALDGGGNTATCSFTITVRDFASVPNCKDLYSVQLDNNCSHTLVAAEVLYVSNPCPSAYLPLTLDKTAPFGNGPWVPATLTAADLNKTYYFRVVTLSGNSCWGTVLVKDSLPPNVSCQEINIPCMVSNFAPAYLVDSLGIATGRPTYSDNCGGTLTATYVDVINSLPCDTASTITKIILRTWTVKDAGNNQNNCLQKINLHRSLADVQFPPDVTLSCSNPDHSAPTNGVPFIALGHVRFSLFTVSPCSIEAIYIDTLVPQCEGTYRIRRTWQVSDACPSLSATNPKIGVQNIDIQDTGKPGITCPPATIVRVNEIGCQGKIKLPDAVITDGCAGISHFTAQWTADGGGEAIGHLTNWPGNNPALRDTLGNLDSLSFATGDRVIQYIATDACGNTSSCTFTLVVADNVPPTARCKPFLNVELSADGTFALLADRLDAGSSDACNVVFLKARRLLSSPCQSDNQFYDAALLCCADIGDTLTLQLKAYDAPPPAGAVSLNFDSTHTSTCTMQVYVTDPQPLHCTAPLSVTVTCDSFDVDLATYGGLLDRSCKADSLEILVDYTQFDTACRQGQIIRTFRVTDTAGGSATCTQQITVQPQDQDYFVHFPNDVIVTKCTSFNYYGEPQLYGLHCERMQVTYTDVVYTVVEDACYKIERTWKIINRCQYDALQALTIVPNPNPTIVNSQANLNGPIISPLGTAAPWAPTSVRVNPNDPNPTNFSTFWSENANGYRYTQIIKIIDGVPPVFTSCPATILTFADSTDNDPEFWNQTYWSDPVTQLHDLGDAPVTLSVTAIDSCSGSDVTFRYLLYLDLDNNGTQETVINSNTTLLPLAQQPTPGTLFYNNANTPNFSGGTNYTFDFRPVVNNLEKYRFVAQTAISGHQKTAWVRWSTQASSSSFINPQLPRGKHKIKWFVSDGCGNESTCQYDFIIRDGLPPVMDCLNIPVERSIDLNQVAVVNLSDLQTVAVDNYTPSPLLQYSMRRAGGGNVFPLNNNGLPIQTLVYNCEDLGIQEVDIWVRDQDKNASFCTTSVNIQDLDSMCAPVNGTISTELNAGVNNVQVDINTTTSGLYSYSNSATTNSDSTGHYAFPHFFASGTSYELTPTKGGDALNGVTTYDLVLINQHILNINPITSPYKLIAADANKSNSITALDILELRRLILGIYEDSLPNNKSWRFVDKSFVFPNPANPFQTPFPETRTVDSLTTNQANDFVAIKIGDLNGSATPHFSGAADDRTTGTLLIETTDRAVQSGETMEVIFRATEAVAGYQFTLEYPGLEVLNIEPGAAMRADNFAVFAAQSAITTSFNTNELKDKAEFTVRFRARETGRLSQFLYVSGRITPAAAYATEDIAQPMKVGLHFGPTSTISENFELLPCIPNPFQEQTTIGFRLPTATAATLRIFDTAGRMVYTRTADYTAGFHGLTIQKSDLGASGGVFFYQLQTPTGSAVRKMVVVR